LRGGQGGGERLQAYLAHAGIASRRAAEELILSGRVSVNGAVVDTLGTKVGEGDIVTFDGKLVQPEKTLRYIAMNKPAGYICTNSDPQGRPLAKSLLPAAINERLYTVGRLDFRSSGLILWTNDGDFAEKVGHPSSNLEKEYLVDAAGPISDDFIRAFKQGIEIEGVFYQALSIERQFGRPRQVRIVLIEGKNREIRRVFSHFHLHPESLQRIRIGPVLLGNLAEGETRTLTRQEIKKLTTNNTNALWAHE
jgi:23S rRNA pseudouridine2605 synthase